MKPQLPTPTPKQLQLTFDTVARHLLRQGRQAAAEGTTSCRYRVFENGVTVLTCAVGCLIPDALYDAAMEGRSVDGLLANYPALREVPEIDHCDDLLGELQSLHDSCAPTSWRKGLRLLAERYELSTEVLGEVPDAA